MNISKKMFICIFTLLIICITTNAYRTHDKKKGSEQNGFVYLDRFGFDHNPTPFEHGDGKRVPVGYIEGTFTFKNKEDFDKTITLWEYTDSENDWPVIYPKNVPCDEKIYKSGGNTHAVLQIDPNTGTATVKLESLGGTRRRIHYVALVHCGGFGEFEYNLHFTRITSNWGKEFGVNEAGLNTFYIIWFILYLGVLGATLFNYKMFHSKQNFVHPLIKLFTISIILSFINIFSELIHWGRYTTDGRGFRFILGFGDIAEIVGSTAFLLLLMLLAQGWAISSGLHNTNLQRRTIIVAITAFYGLLKVIAFLLKLFKSNPAHVGTASGIVVFYNIVLIAELGFAGFYLFSLYTTLKQESNPVKHRFMKFLVLFSIYIVAAAFACILSFRLDPWVRDFLVAMVSITILTAAQVAMLYLLWFTRSAQYFELTSPTELVHDDLNYENF